MICIQFKYLEWRSEKLTLLIQEASYLVSSIDASHNIRSSMPHACFSHY